MSVNGPKPRACDLNKCSSAKARGNGVKEKVRHTVLQTGICL